MLGLLGDYVLPLPHQVPSQGHSLLCVGNTLCAAAALDKQQDGMVALAVQASVLSFSPRVMVWAVPCCVSHKA